MEIINTQEDLLLSDKCWMKNYCQNYKDPNAKCRNGEIYCPKL